MSCKATIPVELESEAYFIAKEDGIVAGIALAEMIFAEVDPSLKVLIFSFWLLWQLVFLPKFIKGNV